MVSALIQPFQWDLRKRSVVSLARFIGVYQFHPAKANAKKKKAASAALRLSNNNKKRKTTLFQRKQNAFQVSHTSGVARHSAAFLRRFQRRVGLTEAQGEVRKH